MTEKTTVGLRARSCMGLTNFMYTFSFHGMLKCLQFDQTIMTEQTAGGLRARSCMGLTNFMYTFSFHGMLKCLQFLVGFIVISIMSYCFDHDYAVYITTYRGAGVYLLLVVTNCTITTLLLLISNLSSMTTSSILPKTVFEYLYHLAGAVLQITAGVSLLIKLPRNADNYSAQMTAAAMILINAGLYLTTGIFAFIAFKSS